MNLLRITNGFEKLTDAELEVRANNILASMTGNTQLPNPQPTLAFFETTISDYSTALTKAKTGSPYDKAVKNEKRSVLIDLLHALGSYVLFASAGNEVIAKSSGFSIAKTPTPAPEVAGATNQKLEDGANAGELQFSFDKVPGAKAYIYQYTPDPLTETSSWESQGGTVRKTVFSGLQTGKKYWCRVLAIGINGQSVYSDPISRVAQ